MVGIVITMVILAAMATAGFVQKFNPDRSSKQRAPLGPAPCRARAFLTVPNCELRATESNRSTVRNRYFGVLTNRFIVV